MSLPSTLFRQEAVEFQQLEREWGGVVLLQPVSTRIMTWSLAVGVAIIVVFLCFAQYARKESVSGYLTISSGRAKVFAPQPGIIKSVYVKEGDLVSAGQPLLTIDTTQVATDGQDVNTAIISTLDHQKQQLLQQIAAEQRRTLSEHARLVEQTKSLEGEISHLDGMVQMQNDRVEIFKKFVSAAQQLNSKGYGSEIEYRRRQQDLLEQQQNLNSLNEQITERRSQLNEARYKIDQLPTVMAQNIQSLRNDLSDVEQRIALANSRRAYRVLAPAAGRVSALQATIGQPADPKRLQMEIVPADSVLQAELFIPTRAIGFVREGQEVRFLYEAFPYQKYGTYHGRIVQLSRTVITGADISSPIPIREPVYKAIAALDRSDIDADGKSVPLQADMLLTADVLLEKRSIMDWLLNPLLVTRIVIDMESFYSAARSLRSQVFDAVDTIRLRLAEMGVLGHDPDKAIVNHSR